MSAICVYLSLPPYLAQWYAHTCRKQRHREDDICPNQPIPLLTPVEPIRGSYESQVLHRVLQKQPAEKQVPEKKAFSQFACSSFCWLQDL